MKSFHIYILKFGESYSLLKIVCTIKSTLVGTLVGWGFVTEVLVTRRVVAGGTLVSPAGSTGGQGNGLCDNIWLEDLALTIILVKCIGKKTIW